ncbi:hypothetical protein FACS1894166_13470 [Bacilli bacterium]|nr:hypothetical protein FACS1894166_13470 [Bacilli bacterium]
MNKDMQTTTKDYLNGIKVLNKHKYTDALVVYGGSNLERDNHYYKDCE